MLTDKPQDPLVNNSYQNTSTTSKDMEAVLQQELGVQQPEPKKSIRQTNLRWVMLVFGCIFLMGSYFCYDIPGVATKTFEGPPYDLTAFQVNLMYIVYSAPNMVLPLFGGVFLDIIGIR